MQGASESTPLVRVVSAYNTNTATITGQSMGVPASTLATSSPKDTSSEYDRDATKISIKISSSSSSSSNNANNSNNNNNTNINSSSSNNNNNKIITNIYGSNIDNSGLNNSNNNNNSSSSSTTKRDGSGMPNARNSYNVYDEPVSRSRLLVCFNAISLITSVVASLLSFFQAISLFLVFTILLNDPLCLVLSLYQVVFGIIIVLVEMEWTETIRQLYIFKSWTTRGLVYAYVGISGLQQQQDILNMHSDHYYVVYFISMAMAFLGLLYFLMGVVCLKRIRDKKMASYIQLLSNFEMQSAYRKIRNIDTFGSSNGGSSRNSKV